MQSQTASLQVIQLLHWNTQVHLVGWGLGADTEIGMLVAEANSAICVQNFDDSLNSAIHITYRNWLRSSSMHEPRDPPLAVVTHLAKSRYMTKLEQFVC